jgi:hypothetical protein
MYAISNAAWIVDQCCEFGKVTLHRSEIDKIFTADDDIWKSLNRFCKENFLSLIFDGDRQIFTFELIS